MPHHKRRCQSCRKPTACRAGLCGPCLDGGAVPDPAARGWRRVMAAGYGPGVVGLPRTVRVTVEERCGGGTRRVPRPADY
jgi:hypothetical protein